MLSNNNLSFSKENLNNYLKELAKEYHRINKMPMEVILVGGASVIVRYGFRDTTTDIDAIYRADNSLKEAANRVGDKFGLPNNWFNKDVMKTDSYSKSLIECSIYYKKFYNVEFRVVSAEYLIAMKMRAGREYKNDLSDIVGILIEHRENGTPISYEQIDKAIVRLYGSWNEIKKDIQDYVKKVLSYDNLDVAYNAIREEEKNSKTTLTEFQEKYPDALCEDNLDSILKNLREN